MPPYVQLGLPAAGTSSLIRTRSVCEPDVATTVNE
jgi:hypothetical protein